LIPFHALKDTTFLPIHNQPVAPIKPSAPSATHPVPREQ
jgi:hypothetical protein